jgi:transcriptional regulator with XRE-family HTH domain
MKTVGEKIAELRKQKNMTQEEFGALLGISAQSISKWENNISLPDITLIPIIADTFDITIDTLFDRSATISSINAENAVDIAFDRLLKTNASYFDVLDKFEEYKSVINKENATATAFYTENGAIFGNQNIGVIYRKSAKDSVPLLRDDEIRTYLAMLADENVCKILAYMAENAKSFTAASIAAKCGLTAKDATATLETLKKHTLVTSRSVDLGDEIVTVWEKYAFHKILFIYSIMALAKKAAGGEDNYYCFHGDYTWG